MQTWSFESSSGSGTYTTVLNEDGHFSCNCRGWSNKRPNKNRECKHTKTVGAQFTTEVRGELVFVLDDSEQSSPPVVVPTLSADGREPLYDLYRSPMLASKMESGETIMAFANGSYVCEEKYDGHRVVIAVQPPVVSAWSRPRAGETRGKARMLPPHIAAAMALFPDGLYDGELIVPGGKSWDVGALETKGLHQLVLFDVIVEGLTWTARRKQLDANYDDYRHALRDGKTRTFTVDVVMLSQYLPPSQSVFDRIRKRGGEGVVLKRIDSLYESGKRSDSWIKVKKTQTDEFAVTGFMPGKNSPCGIVALRDDSGIETTVKALNNEMVRMFEANPQAFIGRRAVIEFQERTPSGSVRHPVWDRFVDE